MKAKKGDIIRLTKKLVYGSAYGLVELEEGTIVHVSERNSSDDGILTVETVTQKNELGERTTQYHVWDRDYEFIDPIARIMRTEEYLKEIRDVFEQWRRGKGEGLDAKDIEWLIAQAESKLDGTGRL